MRFAEIVVTADTDAAVSNRIVEMARACGKNPIVVNDHPTAWGFVANRSYFAMIQEARRVVDEGIAMATMYMANHMTVKAIIALTESGSTTRWMSRIRTDIPIYAFTRRAETRRRVQMYRGEYPVQFDVAQENSQALYRDAFKELIGRSAVVPGDLVIFTKGDMKGVTGGTNAMKILKVS